MQPRQFLSLVRAGFSAAIAQFSITKTYSLAPAREISVFDYTQVLFAALCGFLFFGELPGISSAIGHVLILKAAFIRWAKER